MGLSDYSTKLPPLPELVGGWPNIAGWEDEVQEVTQPQKPVFLPVTNIHPEDLRAAFAVALHMHQPVIPAGYDGQIISNLQYMFEHPNEGDNHDAGSFANCYKRMGDMIPDMVNQGLNPRVMLDYSGALLWGLRQMGRADILDSLKRITCDPRYHRHVEWLGTMWGHAVPPSTPIPDIKLHILAWQQHFAAIFGWDALARVKGFSPPEMALPNHPDALFEYVKALKECGYRWLLVQEHSVESVAGGPLGYKHIPHRLVARNSRGETLAITALIKTQGSDTKLVAQMQPFYEAKTLLRQTLAGVSIPPLVTQIGDGENGGVMMNEFPGAFWRAWQETTQADGGTRGVVGLTGTEYLELIEAAGCTPESYPACQPIGQHQLWQRVPSGRLKSGIVEETIEQLKRENANFHMEGSSWTNDRSWVKGYENVLNPMSRLSALFHQKVDVLVSQEGFTREARYRQALLYNLLLQSSDFRYWGQGAWTEYAREIFRRGEHVLRTEF
jgi:hypothetical protein